MGKSKRKRTEQNSFGDELESPNGMASLSSAVDETVKSFFEGLINGLKSELNVKVNEIREEFRGSLHDVNVRVDSLSRALGKEKEKNAHMEEKLNEMSDCMGLLRDRVAEQEQYSRRNNIRIFGLREEEGSQGRGENVFDTLRVVLKFLNTRLMLRVSEQDVCVCHRLGEKAEGRNRAIIVKFVQRMTRIRILQNKHMLRGSHIVIAEDLSPERSRLFFELREAIGARNVWTREGKIFANTPEGRQCVTWHNKDAIVDAVLHAASTPGDHAPRPRFIGHGTRQRHDRRRDSRGPRDRGPGRDGRDGSQALDPVSSASTRNSDPARVERDRPEHDTPQTGWGSQAGGVRTRGAGRARTIAQRRQAAEGGDLTPDRGRREGGRGRGRGGGRFFDSEPRSPGQDNHGNHTSTGQMRGMARGRARTPTDYADLSY